MTRNQIEYWNVQESKRHNVTTEGETQRHNVATEYETGRHNRVSESIDLGNLNESIRHNKTTETETNRHNLATENETYRHNVRTEGQTDMSLNLDAGRLAETSRANSIRQQELAEQARHNMAQESLSGVDLNIRAGTLQETSRHNVATEQIDVARAQSEIELQAAKTEYQNIVNTWEELQRGQNLKLTDVQIRQAQEYINKMNTEIEVMEKNLQYYDLNQMYQGWDRINDSLGIGAKYIDSLIPG